MQNIVFRSPRPWFHRTYDQFGNEVANLDRPASASLIVRVSSGKTGKISQLNPLPNNAYSFNQSQTMLKHSATYHYASGTVRKEIAQDGALNPLAGGPEFLPTYNWGPVEAKALAKLTEEVRGSLDLSVDLAEAGKTAKMLKLTSLVTDIARTVNNRRLGPLKAVGALWLLTTYGVKPLMQSIFGLAEENLRIVQNKLQSFRVRHSEYFYPTHCRVQAIVGQVDFPVIKGSRMKISLTIGLTLKVNEFDLNRFSSLNPASIAWEMLPLSFVADWFLNIGGYLRQMETALLYNKQFVSGYRTKLAVGEISFNITDVGGGLNPYVSLWNGSCKFVDINRTVLSGYPAPRLPSLRAELGSSRLLSSAALMAQCLGVAKVLPVQRLARYRQRQIQDRARMYSTNPSDRALGVRSPSDWGV